MTPGASPIGMTLVERAMLTIFGLAFLGSAGGLAALALI